MSLKSGNSLYWKSELDNSGLKQGIAEGKGLIKTFASQVTGFDVFAGIGISAGLAFSKASVSAYQFSKEFQTALKEVQTISRATQENYDGIANSLVHLSKSVPDTATQLTKAYYQIVSAGHDGAKGLEILEKSSRAAVAGVTDTITAADGLTTVLNAWKMEAEEVGKVSDIMFTTVRLGKTTFEEISRSIAQVAPLASAMGISFEEVSGMIATLTKQGIPTAEAMTRMRAAIMGLNKSLGDGWSESMTLQEAFIKVREAAKGSDTELKKMLGSDEALVAVLAATGKNAEMAAEDFKEMGNSVGAASSAFEVMNNTADVQLKILGNNLKAKMKDYGDSLLRIAQNFAKNANEMFKSTADKSFELAEKTQKLEKELKPLISRYEELTKKAELSKDEQTELEKIVSIISSNLPTATTAWDKYGKAIGISAEKAEEALERHQRLSEYMNRKAIKENESALKRYEEQVKTIQAELVFGGKYVATFGGKATKVDFSEGEIVKLQNQLAELQGKISNTKLLIDDLKGIVREPVKVEVKTEGEDGKGRDDGYDPEKALEKFLDNLDTAKQAWKEYELLRKAGFLEEVKDEYSLYTEKGNTWAEYLETLKTEYRDHIKELKAINLELAETGINETQSEDMKQMLGLYKKQMDDATEEILQGFYDEVLHEIEDVEFKMQIEPELDYKKLGEELKKFAQKAKLKFLGDRFYEIGNLVSESAELFAELDENLAKTINKFGQAIQGISDIATGLGTGNLFQVISGGIKALSSVIQMFKKDKKTFEEIHAEKIEKLNQSIDKTNKLLSYQLELLNELDKVSWLGQTSEVLNEIERQVKNITNQIKNFKVQEYGYGASSRTKVLQDVDTSKWSMEDFQKMLAKPGGYVFDAETLQILTDQYKQLLEQKADLINELHSELTGTTKDGLVDSIASAFREGKISIEDFADTFEDSMKNAVVNTFKRQFLEKQVQEFYDLFASMSESEGRLTPEEVTKLQSTWDNMIRASEEGWKTLTEGLNLNFGDLLGGTQEKGLAGAIKGVTEETAGLIAGQMGAIRINALESLAVVRNVENEVRQINTNTKELYAIRSILETQNSLTSERALGR